MEKKMSDWYIKACIQSSIKTAVKRVGKRLNWTEEGIKKEFEYQKNKILGE